MMLFASLDAFAAVCATAHTSLQVNRTTFNNACRGSKREGHSRVADCTRPIPEGGYSESARDYSDLPIRQEHKNTRGFRVVQAAGA